MGASSSTKISFGTASTLAFHDDNAELDSQPLNFDTFVPTHDPSLDIPSDPTSNQIPVPDVNYIPAADANAVVSQDEAFSRALNAMYWGGYWTAMYHVRQTYPFLSQVSYTFFFLGATTACGSIHRLKCPFRIRRNCRHCRRGRGR